MPLNPYESPAVASGAEAALPELVLELRELRAVDSFLTLNRLVAGAMIAVSAIALASATALLLTRPLNTLPMVVFLPYPVAGAVLFLGIFQWRLNQLVIESSGTLAVVAIAMLLLTFIGVALQMPNNMARLEFAIFLTFCGLPFVPPILVTGRALEWRKRGINVRDLPRARYVASSKPAEAG